MKFSFYRSFIFLILLILVVITFYYRPVLAQSGLSLNTAMSEAETQNPELKRTQAAIDEANAKSAIAFAGFLPHVGLTGTHIFGLKYSDINILFGGSAINFPSAFPTDEFDLEADLVLFDGFATLNNYGAAQSNTEAATHDLNRIRFEIKEEITKRFYAALAAQELADVATHNIQTLEDHLRLAQATQKAGFATKFEVLRIEAQLEEAIAEKALTDDNVMLARKDLYRSMGLEQDDRRPLVGKLLEPDEKMIPAGLTLDTVKREDYQAQLKRQEGIEKMSKASDAFWWPKISAFGVYSQYQFGSFDPVILSSTFQPSYSYGLKLSWNLFDGGASIAQEKVADAQYREAEQTTRIAALKASDEFEQSKRRFSYSTVLYRARVRAVAKSEESVRLAKIGLRAGTRTHTEVLDAELDLFRSRAGVVQAELDALNSFSNLELAVGRNLR